MKLALFLFRNTALRVSLLRREHQSCSGTLFRFSRNLSTVLTTAEPANNLGDSGDGGADDTGQDNVTKAKTKKEVPCPENSKLMKVAIIGVPNAGKSTIINALTKYDVCPVSKRPHTTRKNQQAVYLDEETQLVFVDTPGLVGTRDIKKFGFTPEFIYGPEKSIASAHVIAVMHDVGNVVIREKLDFRLKAILEKFPEKKSILILNKVDLVRKKYSLLEAVKYLTCGYIGGKPLPVVTFQKKQQSHLPLDKNKILAQAKKKLLKKESEEGLDPELVHAKNFFTSNEIEKGLHQQGWAGFHDVFMVSALEEDGIDILRKYLIVNAEPHRWLFDSETLTNVPPVKLALSILRSKLLDYLPQEIPFSAVPSVDYWNDNESGELIISIKVKFPKERYKWRMIGTNGVLLKKITEETQVALSSVLFQNVKLTLVPEFDEQLAKKFK